MKTIKIIFILTLFIQFIGQAQEDIRPAIGPGSANYTHDAVTIIDGGAGAGDYIIYLPSKPTPLTGNVVGFLHGIFQTNPVIVGGMIDHLVKKGNIVIFSRYHKNELIPSERYMLNKGAKAINNAIQYLLDHRELPQPNTENFALIGHSFGATMVANYAVNYEKYNLPKPKAVLPIQPAPVPGIALTSYEDINEDIKLLTIISNGDVLAGTTEGFRIFNTGPKSEFNNLVKLRRDLRGQNDINAGHEAPLAINEKYNTHDDSPATIAAYLVAKENHADFYCFLKLADALLDCAFENENCHYAFGDTPEQRYMGVWENGIPVRELVVLKHETNDVVLANESITKDTKLTIYPNPFTDYIVVNNANNSIESIAIYALNGSLVYQESVSVNEQTKIDLSEFVSGQYILQLIGEEVQTEKIVKL